MSGERQKLAVSLGRPLLLLAVFLFAAATTPAQYPERDLRARERIFQEAGGVSAIKKDADGRYYFLAARGNTVHVFDSSGARVAQFPPPADPAASPSALAAGPLVFGEDMDLQCPGKDEPCRVYIADRGGNAIRIFQATGELVGSLRVPAPTSVVALSENEVAVATLRGQRLVQVLHADGKTAREFGVLVEVAETPEFNRFLNIGRLATDPGSNVYYAFSYVPEPTVRKYDRFGYAAFEEQLATLDFQAIAQAARREIVKQDRPGRAPLLNKVIHAIGVDPETQDIWFAVGGLLVHLDAGGTRRGSYRLFTAQGARVEPTAILVEAERILIGTDTLGIFDFPRPDKLRR